jgi:hypothetical protein
MALSIQIIDRWFFNTIIIVIVLLILFIPHLNQTGIESFFIHDSILLSKLSPVHSVFPAGSASLSGSDFFNSAITSA